MMMKVVNLLVIESEHTDDSNNNNFLKILEKTKKTNNTWLTHSPDISLIYEIEKSSMWQNSYIHVHPVGLVCKWSHQVHENSASVYINPLLCFILSMSHWSYWHFLMRRFIIKVAIIHNYFDNDFNKQWPCTSPQLNRALRCIHTYRY